MAKKDYEKGACRLLGLVHEDDVKACSAPVLTLGSFKIIGSDQALDQALEKHRAFIEQKSVQWERDTQVKKKAWEKKYPGESYYSALEHARSPMKESSLPPDRFPMVKEVARIRREELKREDALNDHFALRFEDYKRGCGRIDALESKQRMGRGPRNWYDRIAQEFFTELYNPVQHTEDRNGYRRYLKLVLPEFSVERLEADIAFCAPEANHTEHTYLVATTKSGKTELLKTFTYELMQANHASVVFVDPGGDVAPEMSRWPEHVDSDRLVYLDPTLDKEQTFTINPFDAEHLSDEDRIVVGQEIVAAMEAIVGEEGGLSTNMQAVLAPSIRLLLDLPGTDLRDLERLMMDDEDLIAAGTKSKHKRIATFFARDFKGRGGLAQTKHGIANRISKILGWGKLERLICGPSTINLEQVLADKKIVVVRLGQGQLGVEEAQSFGRLLVGLVQGIGLKRGQMPRLDRPMTHLIVDECQNFVTPAIIKIIQEGRKFGLAISLAQLSVGQGMDDDLKTVVLRTTRAKIAGLTDSDGSRSAARLVGVDAKELEHMNPGEFFYKPLGKPTVRFQATDRLLEYKHSMSREQWGEVREAQLTKYYRRISDDGKAEPQPGNEAKSGNAVARKRKLR